MRNTFGMLVLQDFEALRPNLLARTIETVQGGGMVCILLKTMTSLKQLYTMTMVSVSSGNADSRIFTRDTERMPMKMSFLVSTSDSFYPWEHARHVSLSMTNST